MSKKWLVLFILALSVVFVTACEEVPGGTSTLSAIVYTGVADAEIENGVEFNFMTGVKAMGNDGVDYTDQIEITSTSSAVNLTTKALDTTAVGVHAVRYEVVVGEIVARQFRYITVKSPQVVAGEMLVNKDISQGVLGWNDPAVVYIADGASMTLSAEAGELKAVVVAGTNTYTPRFGQMNIPFEQGKTYEVSFEARSSVEKEISLQVGELLTAAPWFNDFLPSSEPIIFRTITTTMQRYSYKFTMTQDNQKGGILFGLGTVKSQKVDATMYFDNFEIVETTPDADTTGPIISGAINRTITVGQAFDPLNGITASDVTDGDVTSNITVVVKNSNNEVVTSVDTTQSGVFTVTYNVKDSLNNETTLSITITVSATEPVIYDLPQYRAFVNDWEGSAGNIKGVDGELVLTLTALNNLTDSWKIQVIQDATAISGAPDNTGHIQFVAGKTYRVTFDAYASVAGDAKLAIGHPGGGWTPYFENAEVAITTEMKSFTYEFTLPAEGDFSTLAQFKIEMGLLFTGLTAPQFFVLDNVLIEEKVDEVFQSTTLILNGTMDDNVAEPVVD